MIIPTGLGAVAPKSVQQACPSLTSTMLAVLATPGLGLMAAPLMGLNSDCISALSTKLACNPPDWCNGSTLASLIPACQTCTPSEMVSSDVGPAMTPENVASAQAAATKDEQSLCAQDPAGCAAYNASVNSPNCTALFGTGGFGQFMCGSGDPTAPGFPGWILAVAAGGILLLVALKK